MSFSEGSLGERSRPSGLNKVNEKNNERGSGSTVSFPMMVIGYTCSIIVHRYGDRYLSEGHTYDIIRINETSKQDTSHDLPCYLRNGEPKT